MSTEPEAPTVTSPEPAARRRIVEGALVLFAEKGVDAVTLRAIGTRVGLHNSSLFHHFRSKAEIARAAFELVLGRVLPKLEGLAEDDPPDLEHFIAALLELVDYFADHPDDARFLTRAVIDPSLFFEVYGGHDDRREDQNPVVRLLGLIWGWLDRARRAGAIRPVAVLQTTRNLFGLLLFEPSYGLGTTYPGSPSQDDGVRRRERRAELADFVRGGLAPVESGE